MAGMTEDLLMERHFKTWARHPHLSDRVRSVIARKEQNERIRTHHPLPSVEYIWGPTSTGKTRSVYDRHDPSEIYSVRFKNDGHIWFDGYEGEKIILIDEFHGQCKSADLLQILRPYQLRVEIKGAVVWPVFDLVYITSNIPPEELYLPKVDRFGQEHGGVPESVRKAILARITKITYLGPSDPPGVWQNPLMSEPQNIT